MRPAPTSLCRRLSYILWEQPPRQLRRNGRRHLAARDPPAMVDVEPALLEVARRVRIALGEQHVAVGLSDAVQPQDRAQLCAAQKSWVMDLSSDGECLRSQGR